MPVQKSNTLINVDDAVNIINHHWHRYVNLHSTEFEAPSYHPIVELNDFLDLMVGLKTITNDNIKLQNHLMVLGLYVLAHDINRFEGQLWLDHVSDSYNHYVSNAFISQQTQIGQWVIDLTANWHGQAVNRTKHTIAEAIENVKDFYANLTPDKYRAIQRSFILDNMFVDDDYTETDWTDAFNNTEHYNSLNQDSLTVQADVITNLAMQMMELYMQLNYHDNMMDILKESLKRPGV